MPHTLTIKNRCSLYLLYFIITETIVTARVLWVVYLEKKSNNFLLYFIITETIVTARVLWVVYLEKKVIILVILTA